MNIAVILPGELPAEGCAALKATFQQIVAPGTKTSILALPGVTIRNAADIDSLEPAAVSKAIEAQQEGCDAVVLHGT